MPLVQKPVPHRSQGQGRKNNFKMPQGNLPVSARHARSGRSLVGTVNCRRSWGHASNQGSTKTQEEKKSSQAPCGSQKTEVSLFCLALKKISVTLVEPPSWWRLSMFCVVTASRLLSSCTVTVPRLGAMKSSCAKSVQLPVSSEPCLAHSWGSTTERLCGEKEGNHAVNLSTIWSG